METLKYNKTSQDKILQGDTVSGSVKDKNSTSQSEDFIVSLVIPFSKYLPQEEAVSTQVKSENHKISTIEDKAMDVITALEELPGTELSNDSFKKKVLNTITWLPRKYVKRGESILRRAVRKEAITEVLIPKIEELSSENFLSLTDSKKSTLDQFSVASKKVGQSVLRNKEIQAQARAFILRGVNKINSTQDLENLIKQYEDRLKLGEIKKSDIESKGEKKNLKYVLKELKIIENDLKVLKEMPIEDIKGEKAIANNIFTRAIFRFGLNFGTKTEAIKRTVDFGKLGSISAVFGASIFNAKEIAQAAGSITKDLSKYASYIPLVSFLFVAKGIMDVGTGNKDFFWETYNSKKQKFSRTQKLIKDLQNFDPRNPTLLDNKVFRTKKGKGYINRINELLLQSNLTQKDINEIEQLVKFGYEYYTNAANNSIQIRESKIDSTDNAIRNEKGKKINHNITAGESFERIRNLIFVLSQKEGISDTQRAKFANILLTGETEAQDIKLLEHQINSRTRNQERSLYTTLALSAAIIIGGKLSVDIIRSIVNSGQSGKDAIATIYDAAKNQAQKIELLPQTASPVTILTTDTSEYYKHELSPIHESEDKLIGGGMKGKMGFGVTTQQLHDLEIIANKSDVQSYDYKNPVIQKDYLEKAKESYLAYQNSGEIKSGSGAELGFLTNKYLSTHKVEFINLATNLERAFRNNSLKLPDSFGNYDQEKLICFQRMHAYALYRQEIGIKIGVEISAYDKALIAIGNNTATAEDYKLIQSSINNGEAFALNNITGIDPNIDKDIDKLLNTLAVHYGKDLTEFDHVYRSYFSENKEKLQILVQRLEFLARANNLKLDEKDVAKLGDLLFINNSSYLVEDTQVFKDLQQLVSLDANNNLIVPMGTKDEARITAEIMEYLSKQEKPSLSPTIPDTANTVTQPVIPDQPSGNKWTPKILGTLEPLGPKPAEIPKLDPKQNTITSSISVPEYKSNTPTILSPTPVPTIKASPPEGKITTAPSGYSEYERKNKDIAYTTLAVTGVFATLAASVSYGISRYGSKKVKQTTLDINRNYSAIQSTKEVMESVLPNPFDKSIEFNTPRFSISDIEMDAFKNLGLITSKSRITQLIERNKQKRQILEIQELRKEESRVQVKPLSTYNPFLNKTVKFQNKVEQTITDAPLTSPIADNNQTTTSTVNTNNTIPNTPSRSQLKTKYLLSGLDNGESKIEGRRRLYK